MSTASLIGAMFAKFDSLTASNFPGGARPPRAFDEMPPTNSSGAQITAEDGYIVLREDSSRVEPMAFGRVTNEVHEMVWEIFYPSLGDCQTTAAAIRRNGGSASQKLGFDGGTLPDLIAPPVVRDIICTQEVPSREGHGKTGKLVHCVRVYHRVCLTRSGS
ncbi:hypothetical protein VT84_14115 [Gemmata sp. SH-PL17]|uniref:hypothetical protein n=1 Tax=Gemmata sp. SH-PL17 TaxID=1630693 RepID=UPI00078B4E6E|nr:hypothetical protein [Gemmata sp. SH-PL17]AMV25529.1 hypothetical protein VT84_14115 [Gemmata sp. SH-PL17]